jgi:hypothetical protein
MKRRDLCAKSAELHEQVAEITNLQAVNATLVSVVQQFIYCAKSERAVRAAIGRVWREAA